MSPPAALALCAAAALLAASATAEAMEWRESSLRGADGSIVVYVVVSAPVASSRLRVMVPSLSADALAVASRQALPKRAALVAAPSGLETAIATPFVSTLPNGSTAVLSGGPSSADPTWPGGLVIANGEVVRQLNLVATRGRSASTETSACRAPGKYRWSGLLCARDGEAGIAPLEGLEAGGFAAVEHCRDAIQSFPLIVEPGGVNGICADEPTRTTWSGNAAKPEARSVVCTDGDLIKLIVTEPTHLYPLAERLIAAEGCDAALNLSGSVQAGIAYRTNARAQWQWWPRTDEPRPPLSSVVVLFEPSSEEPRAAAAVAAPAGRSVQDARRGNSAAEKVGRSQRGR